MPSAFPSHYNFLKSLEKARVNFWEPNLLFTLVHPDTETPSVDYHE